MKKLKFEESLAELEGIVAKLETGETSLEEALKDFELGVSLVKNCREKLDNMEMRIEKIINDQGETQEVKAEDLT